MMRFINRNGNEITTLSGKLIYRVSISRLFNSTPEHFRKDYGGDLQAYSFHPFDELVWLDQFRSKLKQSVGKYYLPVYRMADGEYQFLVGLKVNLNSPSQFRQILSFIYRKTLEVLAGPRIKTSWGETYRGKELFELRTKYLKDLYNLLENGILCAYLYENPKKSHVHYNKYITEFFDNIGLALNSNNLFPFHFPFFALSNEGWQDLITDRNILIITGNLEKRKHILETHLLELGAKKVGFYEISSNHSMKDIIDNDKINDLMGFELAFIGAGIGSLNIISQMKWFKGPVLDVGGYLTALENKNYIYHGGAVKYPGLYKIIK
jgi:hypothetical protein